MINYEEEVRKIKEKYEISDEEYEIMKEDLKKSKKDLTPRDIIDLKEAIRLADAALERAKNYANGIGLKNENS